MKKATKKQVLEHSVAMSQKYFDLVWYARSGHNAHLPYVEEERKKIEKLYSNEVNELSGDEADWTHGFNSGALAAFRFILTIMEEGIEEAYQDFPELDS